MLDAAGMRTPHRVRGDMEGASITLQDTISSYRAEILIPDVRISYASDRPPRVLGPRQNTSAQSTATEEV
jgi:hypothetical protein